MTAYQPATPNEMLRYAMAAKMAEFAGVAQSSMVTQLQNTFVGGGFPQPTQFGPEGRAMLTSDPGKATTYVLAPGAGLGMEDVSLLNNGVTKAMVVVGF